MIVVPPASVALATPVPPVAVPPVLAALASVMLVPSQVGAAVGQVTVGLCSVNVPNAPHVYVVFAAGWPLPELCTHLKIIVVPPVSAPEVAPTLAALA